ncbi:Linker histone H1/H5 [Theobroma cacao]|uniref:HMG-Y-related protein A n=1 Tax=Theobroma cacao TaxID=3641 RepID=A0A061ENL6_THECC|nr:High mobility group A isoform 1 [Theobroma cacao]WRX20352.1 Linker histone H1/H5 [Theobroma cacao]
MATEEVNKPPSLPSYPQMIVNAIEALNDKNGSNKTSISKYIESQYGDLPAGHTTLLSHHLNRMKETGELIFWKNNYMKADPNAPPRRGRGRPPKSKDPLPPGVVLSPARPRGRPPKDPNAPPKSPKPKVASGTGKPRGRPRKMARPAGGIGGSSTTTMVAAVRPRGRPPKVKASALTEANSGLGKVESEV